MFDVKKLVRRLVYDCFPEFDIDSGARSWPGMIVSQLNLTSDRVANLVTLLQGLERRKLYGTVVVLAPESFEGPKFLSKTVTTTPQIQDLQFGFSPLHWPMAPGAWVVAHGCTLLDVYVGNRSQASGPESSYCRITDEIPLGAQLQIRVRFES